MARHKGKGAGTGGSDRITIIWPDYTIHNTWLVVSVKADGLGLVDDDVFYFGNVVAEAGNLDANAEVTVADLLLARNNPQCFFNPVGIDFPYDYNRDTCVNAVDVLLARNNRTNALDPLKLIDLSGGAEEAPSAPLAELVWLSGLDQAISSRRPTEKNDAAAAVDMLLATYFP